MSVPTRTTADKVQKLLGGDYGRDASGNLPDLSGYIETASVLVDQCVALAQARAAYSPIATGLPGNQAEIVERWLAAHFYQQADPGYQSRSTAGASGQFTGQTTMGIENTRYGQQALVLDTTGSLTILNKRQVAGAAWPGKVPSAQIPYEQRD